MILLKKNNKISYFKFLNTIEYTHKLLLSSEYLKIRYMYIILSNSSLNIFNNHLNIGQTFMYKYNSTETNK